MKHQGDYRLQKHSGEQRRETGGGGGGKTNEIKMEKR